MNEKQRRRIERVLDRSSIRDDFHPQGYIVGIYVSHSSYGSGRVVALKKNMCAVELRKNRQELQVPISHLLNCEHGWRPDHQQLRDAIEAYEKDITHIKREYKFVNDARQAIIEEMLSFERGVLVEDLTSIREKVLAHDRAIERKAARRNEATRNNEFVTIYARKVTPIDYDQFV